MRIVLVALFVLHGISHGVGFVVPWRLAEFDEVPYRTTLLAGRLDVGDAGIRVIGGLWLLAGLAFLAVAVAAAARRAWWPGLAGAAAVFSLGLGVLGWPDSRIGVVVNVAILALLVLGLRYGWLPRA